MECWKGNPELINRMSKPKGNVEMKIASFKKKFRKHLNLLIMSKNITNTKIYIYKMNDVDLFITLKNIMIWRLWFSHPDHVKQPSYLNTIKNTYNVDRIYNTYDIVFKQDH